MINIATEDLVLVLYIPHNGVDLPQGEELGLLAKSTHDAGTSQVLATIAAS